MGRGLRGSATAAVATRGAKIELSQTERAQLGSTRLKQNGQPSAHPYPSKAQWPEVRQYLLERSKQSNPNLDEKLTAYTPGETLKLLQHPTVKDWHKTAIGPVGKEYDTIVFVPCAKSKPWTGPAVKKSKLYSAYNQLRREKKNICFVTISEPLGIVPMKDWANFPQYDNPGLFKDDAQRGGMTKVQWEASPFKKFYGLPFDEKAHQECINQLGAVVADFINNNKDKQIISVVDERQGPKSTHGQMLDVASTMTDKKVSRHPKRIEARVSPLSYLRDLLNAK
jgi:hypothetical protein